jgi:hypothetical protein
VAAPTTRERIEALRSHGDFDPYLVAAILGLDVADVARAVSDPNFSPPVPGIETALIGLAENAAPVSGGAAVPQMAIVPDLGWDNIGIAPADGAPGAYVLPEGVYRVDASLQAEITWPDAIADTDFCATELALSASGHGQSTADITSRTGTKAGLAIVQLYASVSCEGIQGAPEDGGGVFILPAFRPINLTTGYNIVDDAEWTAVGGDVTFLYVQRLGG